MQQFTSSGELAVNMNSPGYMAQQHPQQAQTNITSQSDNTMQQMMAMMQMQQMMQMQPQAPVQQNAPMTQAINTMAKQFSTSGTLGTQQFNKVERSSY